MCSLFYSGFTNIPWFSPLAIPRNSFFFTKYCVMKGKVRPSIHLLFGGFHCFIIISTAGKKMITLTVPL